VSKWHQDLGCTQRAEEVKRRIDQVDSAIDQTVYALYGLTEDEIRLVQETATRH
jgi:hypothetical protein